jgi:hypothetical protein
VSDANTLPHGDPGAGPLSLLPERKRVRRGELKTDIAVQRHELMREVLALKNEIAGIKAARCPWCRVRAWWQS